MGSAILEFMADHHHYPIIERIGLPDAFVEHGSIKELYHLCGLDEQGILKILMTI